jgi:glucuronate isomerase
VLKDLLHPDRLFPVEQSARNLARSLFQTVEKLPIISPHGHTDSRWWGENQPFTNAAELFVIPDHYVVRMLVSQGISFEALGIGADREKDPRKIWRCFASHYHLFAATPSRLWLDHAFQEAFGLTDRLSEKNADDFFDAIGDKLTKPKFRPRSLYDRFNIEVIATTDSALDDLKQHQLVQKSDWNGRVIPTYRPDAVVDPDFEGFQDNLDQLGELTGCETHDWTGYLDAHRARRAFFISMGATATDHGHPTASTQDLSFSEAKALFDKVRSGKSSVDENEIFRGQMLTEMARMSVDDGLVMQLHAGSFRNHNKSVFEKYGRDRGFDIPKRTGFVSELKPLLDAVGLNPKFSMILFTLDESIYSRELAPLVGAYPGLKIGPPWWFHDSFEGMRRYRETVIETAGFYNTAGFNDDTRALCSIPARHDVARRADCAFLAELVTSHRLDEDEAYELAPLLANGFARETYKL